MYAMHVSAQPVLLSMSEVLPPGTLPSVWSNMTSLRRLLLHNNTLTGDTHLLHMIT